MPRKPRKNQLQAPTPPIAKKVDVVAYGPPPNRAGRVPKLSLIPRHKYLEMLDLIRLGVTAQAAAGSLGVAPTTFTRWLSKGREGKGKLYKQLWDDVVEAGSFARARNEIEVSKKNPEAWLKGSPAAQFTPDMPRWGEKQTIELIGSEENPIRIAAGQALEVSQGDLYTMLKALEESGYIQITDLGENVLRSKEDKLEIEETDIDDDLPEIGNNGHR